MYRKIGPKYSRFFLTYLLLVCSVNCAAFNASPLLVAVPALTAADLAVIVNDADPLSVKIAKYYQKQRKIPAANMIHINFNWHANVLPLELFDKIKKKVDQQLPKNIQAQVITWIQPFRVECMSLATAFAVGYDPAFCAEGCFETRKNPYFATDSTRPFTDYGWRPTMVLAMENFALTKQLIDRGVASDYSLPQGSAYLLKTSDSARSSRAGIFKLIADKFKGIWPVTYLEQDSLENKTDVMFYFTGLTQVPNIDKNTYLPGAIADHLTSTGGVLSGSDQMNVLDWLKAGATATYGAVVEPCNFPAKFPNPEIVLYFYLRGSSLLEAYWKSVLEPGQGVFVGEPLAKPFAYRQTQQ